MNTKKVLFVAMTTEYIVQHCIPIFKWLKESGYEIHVVSSGNEEIKYSDKHYNLPFIKRKTKTYKILKELIKENNYYFIHCYTFLGGILTRLAARKSMTKIIYTSEEFKFYKGSSKRKWLIYYPLEKYLSRYTDILITNNDEDYILAKNKFKNPKIKLVNELDFDLENLKTDLSCKDRIEFLEEFNLKKEDFIFLCIGNLNENNNQILQIEAVMNIIPEYKNIKLLLVGDGPLEEYYNNIIFKYGLSEYIKLIGKRKDISRILNLSDCLLVTSKKERLSKNVIKAMIANKPIIASRINKHKELLQDDYLVTLNNSDELITKLEKTIIAGKRKVFYNIEKFNLEKSIEQLKKIYKLYIF